MSPTFSFLMVSGSTVTFSGFIERSSKTSLYLQKKRELISFPSFNSHKLFYDIFKRKSVSEYPFYPTNRLQTLKLLFSCSLLKGRVHSCLGVQALGVPLEWNMYTQTSVRLVSSPPNRCSNVWLNLPYRFPFLTALSTSIPHPLLVVTLPTQNKLTCKQSKNQNTQRSAST